MKSKKSKLSKLSKRQKTGGSDKKIDKYVDQLCEYFQEHNLQHFWYEFDSLISKRQKGLFIDAFKKIPDQFVGKRIVSVRSYCYNKRKDSEAWKNGYLFSLQIIIYRISKDGSFDPKNSKYIVGHLDLLWKRDDLKLSKFSIKLLEEIVQLVYKNKLKMANVGSYSFSYVVKEVNSFEKYHFDQKKFSPIKL